MVVKWCRDVTAKTTTQVILLASAMSTYSGVKLNTNAQIKTHKIERVFCNALHVHIYTNLIKLLGIFIYLLWHKHKLQKGKTKKEQHFVGLQGSTKI